MVFHRFPKDGVGRGHLLDDVESLLDDYESEPPSPSALRISSMY